jgi:PAS domain S-box-containing protein
VRKKTYGELEIQSRELHARLQEAEESLQAIREGEVDALVINGPQGRQVYTLKDADRNYRIVIEEMSEGVVTLNECGTILYSNKQYSRMLHMPLEKLMGSSIYDFLDPINHETMANLLSGSKEKAGKKEIVFKRQDNVDLWATVSLSPFQVEQSSFFCGVITDHTEQKMAEKEKKSLENQLILVHKMEALGRFAGGIAHDLNNILYPIIIDTESLLAETSSGTPMYQTLAQILKAANRQKHLIRQILSFSRRNEQQLIPIRVIPIVMETLDLLRSSLPRTITIKHYINTLSDIILGNPTQIQQIVMNLFRNAADSIDPQRGTIEIRLENMNLNTRPSHPEVKAGTYLALTVRDTGHGMTPEVMDKIFEPFFTTKEASKGSGMGLAVVHGILNLHRGTIMVESEPGKGSQFTVYLPLTDEKLQSETPSSEKASIAQGKGKVLLIDDEELILKSIQNALKRLGYEVVSINDGLQALKLFTKNPDEFDIIITDLTMPHITGIELANKIIEIRSDIPVILCTGFNDAINEEEAKAFGIRGLLLKPASTQELNQVISNVLESG